MGSFWGGFAGTMKDQIGQARTAGLEEEAKQKEQERRQAWASEERALDRADKAEDRNFQLDLADSKDPSNIAEVIGPAGTPVYVQSVRSIGPDGKIQITSEQVTDTSTIAKYKEYKKSKEDEEKKTAMALEKDSLELESARFKVKNQGRVLNAELAATNRQGRGGGRGGSDDYELPPGEYGQAIAAKEEVDMAIGTANALITGGRTKNRNVGNLEKFIKKVELVHSQFEKGTIDYPTFKETIDALMTDADVYNDVQVVDGKRIKYTLRNYRNSIEKEKALKEKNK